MMSRVSVKIFREKFDFYRFFYDDERRRENLIEKWIDCLAPVAGIQINVPLTTLCRI